MPISSISMFLHRATPLLPLYNTSLRRASPFRLFSVAVAVAVAARQPNPNNVWKKPQQPLKNLLKARDNAKHFSSLSQFLCPEDETQLSQNQAIGMVASAQANFMRVVVESVSPESSTSDSSSSESSGQEGQRIGVELLCVVRAVLKKIKRRVLVGDKVVVGSIDWVDRRGMIENVFQRTTEILEPPVANVDHLLVLFSMEQPKLEPFALTRFLVEAESTGIPITLVLNKSELVDEETLISWKSRLRRWGYEPIFCSVESKHGLDTLEFILREQNSVIVGPSGVGKSSLINALRSNQSIVGTAEGDNWFDHMLGNKWFEDQRVGEVSTRSGRGKHTTRNVSLLPLSGGGYLADTPGFNQPSLMKVTKQSLAQHFPEIQKMLEASETTKCSFNNCLHLGEPGCVVKGDWERYPYYFQLFDEIKIREEFQLRTLGTKRESDVRYKAGDMGVKQAEPRLETKKHRRQSRKKTNQSIMNDLDELDDEDNLFDDENPILRAMRHENQS
ncbi:small ribosomal subunit biogenesis GTPase RsgA 1, mitochondrial [Cornus florida]|uniref:small ribosomal subunit biogenesis GTPase RsgA 1, mitochondrial n=1 Tax=Cornus florida TaxID=4283 RepID=UPI00289AC69B|nr:small ribosomal subunit biogenesis GTPase RsgA 1, mitochondrial [Cornus florida]